MGGAPGVPLDVDGEEDVTWVGGEVEAIAAQREALLAGGAVAPEPAALAELDADERVLLFPPDLSGWSAHLPACRTVLPAQPRSRSLLRLLTLVGGSG